MPTETTIITDTEPSRGWIFYDADCDLCVRMMRRVQRLFVRRGFSWVPLQTPGAAVRLRCLESELMSEMRVKLTDGRVLGGTDAWIELFARVGWLRPAGWLLGMPGIHFIANTAYRWMARNRRCLSGACRIRKGDKR